MRLLTWNVYFGGHMFEERRAALIDELARRRPEVIALQEVTAEDVIELPGYVSTLDEFRPAAYGVAILARVQIESVREYELPSEMGRTLLVVELSSGVTVATVHLESMDEADRRIAQLAIVQRRLASRERVVLCGDFNFTPAMAEQRAIDPAWTDAWAHDAPGYTVDSDANAMRFQLKEKRTQKRIDRVLLRGLTAKSIELVGTSAIDVDGTFVSDHFGLEAELA